MAVNKNFVVKNGLEVSTDLILANAETTQVGIATTALEYTLHVNGGVGATDSYVSAASTVIGNFQVGTGGTVFSVDPVSGIGSVGVGTASPAYLLDVRSPVSTGQTALYVQGDVRITGDLNVDDITFDDAILEDLTVTKTINVTSDGTLNVTGVSTFASAVDINANLDVSGTSTLNGTVNLPDDTSLFLGNDDDLELFHAAGGNSYIKNNSAALEIRSDATTINSRNNSVTFLKANASGLMATTGIVTATQIDLNGDIDVDGHTNLDNVSVAGVTTSTDKEIYNQFDIGNSGSGAYQFAATGIGFTQATNNPTLYLTRGKNYRFSVNASGHPFYIKTVNSTGTGNAYGDGVTNNGAAVGIITFKVPYNAPDILHYNCSIHSSMHGEIRVGSTGGGVGIGSEGTFIGVGATMIDFKSSNGNNTVDLSAGIATVTVQTGVSLGLAIALGG